MVARKKKRSTGKTFRFQLSLGGIAGIAVVSFCLFLWMFLLGIWAGQTILLPSARTVPKGAGVSAFVTGDKHPVRTLADGAKKKPGENKPQR
jgi:hypothetical protein